MPGDQERKWNERYRASERVPEAARVLRANLHLLPQGGRSLDVACGLGGNCLELARLGFDSHGWDLSSVAIAALRERACTLHLPVTAEIRDVELDPPAPDSFDVIVVAHYLHRALAGALVQAVRPGGVLLYQTFTRAQVDQIGPKNPGYRLGDNELLRLFVPPMKLRAYREEGTLGDVTRGFRNLAMLVAQRDASTNGQRGG